MTTDVKVMFFLGFLALVFFMPALGTLFGALSGWVVGLFFGDTILGFLSRMGVDTAGFEMWQVGAAMGFFGGFLKTSVHKPSK